MVKKVRKNNIVALKKKSREFNTETKRRREKNKSRSDWLDDLQKLVNQYVKIRDKGKPCCTCGTTKDVQYCAGHYLSRGARPELRFVLTNIHLQCNFHCNNHLSGNRAEYDKFIISTYGQDHYNFLVGPYPSLKELFPHIDDIRSEMSRYRALIKDMK